MPVNVECLIVDTSAFLNNIQLQDIAKNTYTVDDVVEEVRCKRQLRRLIVLPYDLLVKDVDPENIAFVTQFSKKTGDYSCLSSTDIKLIALTYQMEKEKVGIAHLRTEPVVIRIIKPLVSKATRDNVPGFYSPKKSWRMQSADSDDVSDEPLDDGENDDDFSGKNLQEVPNVEYKDFDEVIEQFTRLGCEESQNTEDKGASDGNKENEHDEMGAVGYDWCAEGAQQLDSCVTDSDEAGWITPSNLRKRSPTASSPVENPENPLAVACLTADFAMQNVLKQIGLNVVSFEGRVIEEIRKFALRCYSCFHVTPQTTRIFCPKCGNKTLKRVSVYVSPDGKHHVLINFKHPITARGKKFPLPRPKGGKHAVNPILCEDQRVPQQRLSQMALKKTNPMHPDYIAGVSPFAMRDVSSRSAVLHAANGSEIKYWMRKNPNEVVKRRRKK